MVPNSDLILLALLYGTFVAGVLIAAVLLALAALALAFAAGLLSIVAVDSCGALRLLSSGLGAAKADVELGLVLLLCAVLRCGVSAASLAPELKPWVERGVGASTEAARRARDHFS
ncbi:hypothetical protein NL676_033915 [Syzygium grande]|nr:hypothetical protein NL676_033915 [Syzygium grande]